ncbi:MAG: hypothetical protein U0838_07995 [Chloroflexota bacterium]
MSKASQQHIAQNEAVIASGTASPAAVAMAKQNVDLWLSIEGQAGKYGTEFALPPTSDAPPAPARAHQVHTRPSGRPAQGDALVSNVDAIAGEGQHPGELPASFEERVRTGRATDDDIEEMTYAQYKRYVERFPPETPEEWISDPRDRERDTRTKEQAEADLVAEWASIDATRREHAQVMEGLHDRLTSRAQAIRNAEDGAYRDMLATMKTIGVEGPEAEAAARVAGRRAGDALRARGTSPA